jgi:7-carboxy-7-deazaguanine synthase
VKDLVARLAADGNRVVLMPEGTTRAAVGERSLWLAEIAKREGWRFTPRLHIDLWGDKRGV